MMTDADKTVNENQANTEDDKIKVGDITDSSGIAIGPGASATVNKGDIFDMSGDFRGSTISIKSTIEGTPPPPAPTFPLRNLPFRRNLHFTGRTAWLTRLHTNLNGRTTVAVTQAIAGLGGVGKTQLVLEYCYRHQDQYALIYWLSANDSASLRQSLAELAYTLAVAQRGAGDQAAAVQAALGWLENTDQRWLLVYDNADHIQPQELPAYLPKLGNGVSLITSRNPNWHSVTGTEGLLSLDVFPPEEAVAFLAHYTGQTSAAAAEELARELGYLPLALEHAAAYIVANKKTYAAYLKLYEAQRQKLWARAATRHDYQKTITTTWELAFGEAKKTPGAAELLNLCCFLAPDAMPLTHLTDYSAALPQSLADCVADELAWDDALTALSRYSLLTRSASAVSVHRLVQAVGRDRMGAERQALWSAAAVKLTRQTFPDDPNQIYTWAAAEQLLPHARAAADLSRVYDLATKTTASLCNLIGFYLTAMGNYMAARPYYEAAVTIGEQYYGENHPETAPYLNNLGGLLQAEGDYAAARPYLERALAIREESLGPDHPATATSLNDLAGLFKDMGNYAEAKPYYKRTLVIYEKTLGENHPWTATVLNNLGQLL
ncbi:MAG: tetratricopeptide repeat protein, partial [Anaerolineae bacterium]|nr:tetratricopeptide repeat protein [Anaerolineae bacterium]